MRQRLHRFRLQLGIIFLYVLVSGFVFPAAGQQQDEIIKEKVKVVNIEVPVRVFSKGKPVDNLTRADFKLFEGKKEQEINGFFIKRKKIKIPQAAAPPSRYFVLVFNITEFNENVRDGLAHLFNNILRKEDRLMLIINKKTQLINRIEDLQETHERISKQLQAESVIEQQQMFAYLKKIEKEIDRFKQVTTQPGSTVASGYKTYLKTTLQNYLSIFLEYRDKFLTPDIDRYYYLARHLEKIKLEKWVLNFYQLALFPRLSNVSKRFIWEAIYELQSNERPEDAPYSTILTRLANDIEIAQDGAKDFPADDVSKLFYKVDATFHSIFMHTFKVVSSEELDYKRVSTDIENSLRELTKKTGGTLIDSNDLESALNTISEKEDVYYMLTYAPKNPKKVKKIKVKVSDQWYDVIYDNNIRADYITEYINKKEAQIPSVQLQDLSFKKKKLSMVIANFMMKRVQGKDAGMLNVRIRIKDSNGKLLYDKNKNLQPQKNSINISIGFDWLQQGEYDIIVDVMDKITGKSKISSTKASIRK